MHQDLDPHAKPPEAIRNTYKRLQKLKLSDTSIANEIIDVSKASDDVIDFRLRKASLHNRAGPQATFSEFSGTQCDSPAAITMYEVGDLSGLFIFPNLFPKDVQLQLLEKVFHRDLSDPQHLTNVHMHYDVPPAPDQSSYFSSKAESLIFSPKDSAVHKFLSTKQFLEKKLRWMTLGGQYDWTNKVYPAGSPPPFPSDLKKLIEALFPMKAEAAIVNLYSPGDTLSLHRDVSEECDQPLVSISLGCDGIFVVGLDNGSAVTLRLRSGDAVLMSGDSRYAWHGVPKVLANTCPEWMQDWPTGNGKYEEWRGWMAGKRINLNVRQMFEMHHTHSDPPMDSISSSGQADLV